MGIYITTARQYKVIDGESSHTVGLALGHAEWYKFKINQILSDYLIKESSYSICCYHPLMGSHIYGSLNLLDLTLSNFEK